MTVSTGARINVWFEDDGICAAALADRVGQPQVCLLIDLFEVIAELAGLDLENETQAAEASRLATQASVGRGPSLEPAADLCRT